MRYIKSDERSAALVASDFTAVKVLRKGYVTYTAWQNKGAQFLEK